MAVNRTLPMEAAILCGGTQCPKAGYSHELMFVSERVINPIAFNTGWTMDMLCNYFYYLTGATWG
jgi:hypothetical protein